MRATLKELLELLGVGYELTAYATCPWSYYDSAHGATCSAEVRMGPDLDEIEAEIQVVYDEPKNGNVLEQVMWMRAVPHSDRWTPAQMRLKGLDDYKEIYDWETKACNFFTSCVQCLQLGEFPDFEELIERAFRSRERFGDKRGGGGKSPKIKPGQLMNVKKGGF